MLRGSTLLSKEKNLLHEETGDDTGWLIAQEEAIQREDSKEASLDCCTNGRQFSVLVHDGDHLHFVDECHNGSKSSIVSLRTQLLKFGQKEVRDATRNTTAKFS